MAEQKNIIVLDSETPFHLDPKFESAIMQKINGGSYSEWRLYFSFKRNNFTYLIWVGSTGEGLIQCETTVTDEYGVFGTAEGGNYWTDFFKVIAEMVHTSIKYAHQNMGVRNPTAVFKVGIRHSFDYGYDMLYTYVMRQWGEFPKPTNPRYKNWGWQHSLDGKLTEKEMKDMGMDPIALCCLEDEMYEGLIDEITVYGNGSEADADWCAIRQR